MKKFSKCEKPKTYPEVSNSSFEVILDELSNLHRNDYHLPEIPSIGEIDINNHRGNHLLDHEAEDHLMLTDHYSTVLFISERLSHYGKCRMSLFSFCKDIINYNLRIDFIYPDRKRFYVVTDVDRTVMYHSFVFEGESEYEGEEILSIEGLEKEKMDVTYKGNFFFICQCYNDRKIN